VFWQKNTKTQLLKAWEAADAAVQELPKIARALEAVVKEEVLKMRLPHQFCPVPLGITKLLNSQSIKINGYLIFEWAHDNPSLYKFVADGLKRQRAVKDTLQDLHKDASRNAQRNVADSAVGGVGSGSLSSDEEARDTANLRGSQVGGGPKPTRRQPPSRADVEAVEALFQQQMERRNEDTTGAWAAFAGIANVEGGQEGFSLESRPSVYTVRSLYVDDDVVITHESNPTSTQLTHTRKSLMDLIEELKSEESRAAASSSSSPPPAEEPPLPAEELSTTSPAPAAVQHEPTPPAASPFSVLPSPSSSLPTSETILDEYDDDTDEVTARNSRRHGRRRLVRFEDEEQVDVNKEDELQRADTSGGAITRSRRRRATDISLEADNSDEDIVEEKEEINGMANLIQSVTITNKDQAVVLFSASMKNLLQGIHESVTVEQKRDADVTHLCSLILSSLQFEELQEYILRNIADVLNTLGNS